MKPELFPRTASRADKATVLEAWERETKRRAVILAQMRLDRFTDRETLWNYIDDITGHKLHETELECIMQIFDDISTVTLAKESK